MLDGYQFAIFTHDGKFIGTADYREVDHVKRSCTVGVTIGDKNYWEKGYGTDALSVLAEYLFNRLNLRRIQLDTWSGRTIEQSNHTKNVDSRLRVFFNITWHTLKVVSHR